MDTVKHTTKITLCIIAVALASALLAGCGGGGGGAISSDVEAAPTRMAVESGSALDRYTSLGKWTILVYMDADNNLEPYAMQNLQQMETVGSSENVRIVVQIDRAKGYDQSDGDWTDTRRYLVMRDNDPEKLGSIRLDADAPLGELDMANPDTLKDFVEWGARMFPAEHYCVILWNHGTGWEITRATSGGYSVSYVLSDDSSGCAMNITDIPYALSGVKPDILAFDACYMQQVEVAYQLRNSADYLVASTGEEPAQGFPYASLLAKIGANSSPQQVGKAIVDTYVAAYKSYSGITMSMVDLSQIHQVAVAINDFAGTLQSNQDAWASFIKEARAQAIDYSANEAGKSRYLIDMGDYANRCSTALGGSVTSSSVQLTDSIKQAVAYEKHGSDGKNATGLSIYFPERNSYNPDYAILDFARVTTWDTLISTL